MQLKEMIANLPDKTGVYLFKDKRGKILYIGKAKSIRKRVTSYLGERPHSYQIPKMLEQAETVEAILTDTEREAILLEASLVRYIHPKYNIILQDDKSWAYIKITSERFPCVQVVRKVEPDKAYYYGPLSPGKPKKLFDLFRKRFGIRDCKSMNKKGCLSLQMGACSGPCLGNITEEEYRRTVDMVRSYLKGVDRKKIVRELSKEMDEASKATDYEEAARLRDQVNAFKDMDTEQKVVIPRLYHWDIIATESKDDRAISAIFHMRDGKTIGRHLFPLIGGEFGSKKEVLSAVIQQYYMGAVVPSMIIVEAEVEDSQMLLEWLTERRGGRSVKLTVPKRGEKLRLLNLVKKNAHFALEMERSMLEAERLAAVDYKELKKVFKLRKFPHRIEAFDISILFGTSAVGSMVVFERGQPKRGDYRRYKIKSVIGQDDPKMIEEVVRRRYRRLIDEDKDLPDLILVDGGRTQVDAAARALKELKVDTRAVPLFGLAKEFDNIYKAGKAEPIQLPKDSSTLFLLQRIRDEAHRLAITYHKKLRLEGSLRSTLDEIPGIGKKKRDALLMHFKGLNKLSGASKEELMEVEGIGEEMADKIIGYYSGGGRDEEDGGLKGGVTAFEAGDIKAILADIEGTLTTAEGRDPPERLLTMLKELEEKGIDIVLCSGRDRRYILDLKKSWGLSNDSPMVMENGCGVFFKGKESINYDGRKFPRKKIIDTLEREGITKKYDLDPAKEHIVTIYPKGFFKDEIVSRDEVMELYEKVTKALDGVECNVVYSSVSADIMPPGIDKAKGIEKYCEVSGITGREIMFLGDGNNDITAGKYVVERGGVVGVPKNAVKELKETATYVAKKRFGEGALEVLNKYLREKATEGYGK